MAHLTTKDYYEFITSALQSDRGSIFHYFKDLYNENKLDNESDFFNILNSQIQKLQDQFDIQKEHYIIDCIDYRQSIPFPEYSITGQKILKEWTKEDFQNIKWNEIPFFYFNGKVSRKQKKGSVEIYEVDIRNLLRGIEDLDSYLKSNNSKEVQTNNKVKLNWVLDDKQLYYVIRQLVKDHNAIDMDYPKLAEFIKQNVVGFENKNIRTITTSLSRNLDDTINFPKNKRVKVKIDEGEKK